MSGTFRSGLPSVPVHSLDLLSAAAPHASERIHVGHRSTKVAPASWAREQVRARRLTDFVIVILATAASIGVGVWTDLVTAPPGATEVTVAGVFAVTWFVALRVRRTPEFRTIGQGAERRRLVVATLAAFGLLAVVNGFVHIDGVRAYLLVGLPAGLLLLIAGRTFWQRRLNADRSVGLSLPRALIVGSGPDIDFVAEQFARAAAPKYVVAGVVFSDGLPESDAMTSTGFPAFDGINAVTDAIAIANADVVILAGHPGDGGEFVRALSWRLESSHAELVLAWCLDSVDGSRMRFDTANGLPMTHVATPTFSGGKHHVKRAMDVVLSGAALLMLAPLFALIALLIRRDSRGPVFFRQERVGVDGSRFTMIKFRTMVPTAEADLVALMAQDEGNGVMFKLRSDPRVTRIGAKLRRFSLDELPQLWNIFVGDMSVVGPRPPLVREVEQYDDRAQRRLYIKPGLTGAWQVGGRSDLSWEESVRLDLHYVENWSVLGDVRIIMRTVGVVIRPVGAY
jgi:exopolysaccharide biosynthesis polyprenyl glycosylphosphotransferase